MNLKPETIRAVVENGFCIGCGLCEALAPERWQMRMTPQGRLRPMVYDLYLNRYATSNGGYSQRF